GLTEWIREPKSNPKPPNPKPAAPVVASKPNRMSVADSPSAKLIPLVSPIPSPLPIHMPNISKALWPEAKPKPAPDPKREPQRQRRAVDIGAALTRVLPAGGLLKEPPAPYAPV